MFKNVYAFPDINNYYLPVGVSSQIGLNLIEQTKLPTPFSNCTDSTTNTKLIQSIYYGNNYSVSLTIF